MVKKRVSLFVLAVFITVMIVGSVFAENEDIIVPTPTNVIGDLNGDLSFNSIDFGLMRKYILGMIKSFEVEDELYAADVNGDTLINSLDFAYMRQMLLGLITEFPKNTKEGFVQVSCGESYTIALKKDGTVWAWGYNSYGQLGLSEAKEVEMTPKQIDGLKGITKISAGKQHTLALKSDGTVWAWGYNYYGQLGDESNTRRNTPVQVKDLSGVKDIEAGSFFSTVLKDDGTVWGWGYNYKGQIGNGTGINSNIPVQAIGVSNITKIAVGDEHILALDEDKNVWVWGAGAKGQLGNGTIKSSSRMPEILGNLSGVKSISAGTMVSAALKEDGTLWMWGDNKYGMMGNSNEVNSTPVQREVLSDIMAVELAQYCVAALKNDGTVWTWGKNDNGILGSGSALDSDIPTIVSGTEGVEEISCGETHMAIIKSDGTVWTWGYNKYGQLGNGAVDYITEPIKINSFSDIDKIVCGVKHVLAIGKDKTIWAWGNNDYLQLINDVEVSSESGAKDYCNPFSVKYEEGIKDIEAAFNRTLVINEDDEVWFYTARTTGLGDEQSVYEPYKIEGLEGLQVVSIGKNHFLALKGDGYVYSAGNSYWGQLGDGTQTHHNNYVETFKLTKAKDLTNVVTVAAGSDHSVALKNDGTVWTWGCNQFGELAHGTDTFSLEPVQAEGLENVCAISAGNNNNMALKEDGTVWAWGDNTYGQLGNGTTDKTNIPVQVEGLENIKTIIAGKDSSFAFADDGTVWAWGKNNCGQLGDGTTENKLTPIQIKAFEGCKSIVSGIDFTMVLMNDGTVIGVGSNISGVMTIGFSDRSLIPVKIKIK